jgi:hypothetical protein
MSTENTQAELNAVEQEITKTKLKVASDVGGMVGCVLLAGSAASLIGLPVVVGSLAYVAFAPLFVRAAKALKRDLSQMKQLHINLMEDNIPKVIARYGNDGPTRHDPPGIGTAARKTPG